MTGSGYVLLVALGLVAATFSGTSAAMADNGHVREISFSQMSGWAEDDHVAALSAFSRFCGRANTKDDRFLLPSADLCDRAAKASSRALDKGGARRFFEESFIPLAFRKTGFVTGYFEPELAASRSHSSDYPAALLAKPDGLVAVTDANRPADWPSELSHGRETGDGLRPLPDRAAIMDGALAAENLELVFLKDPIDAFFVHVQGSARLRLEDGSVMRVGYAGKTGHPYSSIARVLVERGEGTPEQLTMSGLRRWLTSNPDKRDELFRQNRSFIFFREIEIVNSQDGPIGSADLPLVAGRSLAVDPRYIPFGLPVFVTSEGFGAHVAAGSAPRARTMIADDSGSAIKGAARGDIFVGSGENAGQLAGEIRHSAEMVVLVPNEAVDRFLARLNEAS